MRKFNQCIQLMFCLGALVSCIKSPLHSEMGRPFLLSSAKGLYLYKPVANVEDMTFYPYVYEVATDREIEGVRHQEGIYYEIQKLNSDLKVSIDYYYWAPTLGFAEKDEAYLATDEVGRKIVISYEYWDLINQQ